MSGTPWSERDLALLKRMDDRGVSIDAMAERLKRPKRALEVKLYFVRMGPEGYADYLERNRVARARRRDGLSATAAKRVRRPIAQHQHVPLWHGRCPAFRPRTEADSNMATRL